MEIIKIAGVGLLTAVINQILKKADKEEIATFTNLAGLIIVLVLVLDMVFDLFGALKSMFSMFKIWKF